MYTHPHTSTHMDTLIHTRVRTHTPRPHTQQDPPAPDDGTPTPTSSTPSIPLQLLVRSALRLLQTCLVYASALKRSGDDDAQRRGGDRDAQRSGDGDNTTPAMNTQHTAQHSTQLACTAQCIRSLLSLKQRQDVVLSALKVILPSCGRSTWITVKKGACVLCGCTENPVCVYVCVYCACVCSTVHPRARQHCPYPLYPPYRCVTVSHWLLSCVGHTPLYPPCNHQ